MGRFIPTEGDSKHREKFAEVASNSNGRFEYIPKFVILGDVGGGVGEGVGGAIDL